jgi:hypothetical protein
MGSLDETILRTVKEITVKFIEMGRISPVTFSENFKNIYQTVSETIKTAQKGQPEPEPASPPSEKKKPKKR